MNQWNEIADYLLNHPDCKNIHKLVWDGEAYLTEQDGTRHKVADGKHGLCDVKILVNHINRKQRECKKQRNNG